MKSWIATLLFILASATFADDTPFLSFRCHIDRDDTPFKVKFKNDNSQETFKWESDFKRTKIRIDKVTKSTAFVTISTGLPVIAQAAPEEFRFSASLEHKDIQFTFGMKPLSFDNEFFSFYCKKY